MYKHALCLRRKVRQQIGMIAKNSDLEIFTWYVYTRRHQRMQCAREEKNEIHDGKIRIYEIFIVECKLQNVQLLHI